jgi:2-keto-3-deoxy-L-rhamnonate aldolase RhmA
MPTRDPGTVLKCLDAGAVGILFPWVNSAEDASRAVSTARYPPLGVRGLAGNRTNDWTVAPETTARANDAVIVIAQIETVEAVEAVDALCSVEGVDVLFVGPADLSQSLGFPGEPSHPAVVEAIDHVAAAVTRSEKAFGIFAGSVEDARRGLDLGATLVATSVESLLGGPMRAYLAGIRGG